MFVHALVCRDVHMLMGIFVVLPVELLELRSKGH